jgi:hypothetical protein
MAFLLGVIGVPVLLLGSVPTLLGFTTGGIAAGSLAAASQAATGNVVAGSCFAAMQSMGATGLFSTLAGWGGTATAGAGFFAFSGGNEELPKDSDATHFLVTMAFLGCAAAAVAGLLAFRGGEEQLTTDGRLNQRA